MPFHTLRLLTLLAGLLCLSTLALAHAASTVTLKFDPETKLLTITAQHMVSNASTHYINKVEVFLNGKKIISQTMSSQTDKNVQQVQYIINDAKAGAKIKAAATCNKYGTKTGEITVK